MGQHVYIPLSGYVTCDAFGGVRNSNFIVSPATSRVVGVLNNLSSGFGLMRGVNTSFIYYHSVVTWWSKVHMTFEPIYLSTNEPHSLDASLHRNSMSSCSVLVP